MDVSWYKEQGSAANFQLASYPARGTDVSKYDPVGLLWIGMDTAQIESYLRLKNFWSSRAILMRRGCPFALRRLPKVAVIVSKVVLALFKEQ